MMTTADDPFAQVLPNVHEGVRKSALMCALDDRLGALPPGAFPFAAEFGRLRDLIAPQIGDTRILFPEFTPHDEELHVVKLFQLADRLFGNAYPNLKAVELFLLGCALYAHDWGMAVGSKERAFLKYGARPKDLDNSFAPLPDEPDRLRAFIRSEGLKPAVGEDFPDLTDQHLRLYVRQTHARRSGARVRAHFHEHPTVGEALAQLCEGHWHDFATLDDPQRFHREYEVAGETAHLLALALQVRLIDLFHITHDRTPYALWRFVSPTDRLSEQEWRKHRALHELSCIDFPPGRAIKVQGSTEDEAVWAGLQDLRRYCEEQVTKTLDLSARHVPERYRLDFLKLEWKVTTGALRPVDFAFGFDRCAMFRILSDDIYDGERHVFLRELLQNAIDAIRTRRSRWQQRFQQQAKRRQATPPFDTTIYFTAVHGKNGDIEVTCRDHGIGMDEHIIRNYFSVAGVSYYRSTEFERQGLGFEPISRFGIGILSCFMVADSLQVRTYRDPDCAPPMAQADLQLPGADAHRARRLHLTVPAVDRQFIVKDGSGDFEVGTEVSLSALNRKVRSDAAQGVRDAETDELDRAGAPGNFQRGLKVTEYLCEIAGFVEFPIYVDERWPGQPSPLLTLILHPDRDPEQEQRHFDPGIVVHQLRRDYPWERVTAPECLEAARGLMTAHRFELKELLGDEGYEGWVSFPAPKEGDIEARDSQHWGDGKMVQEINIRGTNEVEEKEQSIWFQWNYEGRQTAGLSGVYRDGILLKDVRSGDRFLNPEPGRQDRIRSFLPPPCMLVNLTTTSAPKPNVARTRLAAAEDQWDMPIWMAIRGRLEGAEIAAALSLPPAERIHRLGGLMDIFPLTFADMLELVPAGRRVRVWLVPPGRLEYREGPCGTQSVCEIPEDLFSLVNQLAKFQSREPDRKPRFEWEGRPSVLSSAGSGYFRGARRSGLSCAAFWTTLVPEQLRLLVSPGAADRPLFQFEGRVVEADELGPQSDKVAARDGGAEIRDKHQQRIRDALMTAMRNPQDLTPTQALDVYSRISLRPVLFPEPFEDFPSIGNWSHGSLNVNIGNSVGVFVIRCMAAYQLAQMDERIPVSETFHSFELIFIGFRDLAQRLFDIVRRNRLIDDFVPPEIADSMSDTGTLVRAWSDTENWGIDGWMAAGHFGRFGQIITQWPPAVQEDEDPAA